MEYLAPCHGLPADEGIVYSRRNTAYGGWYVCTLRALRNGWLHYTSSYLHASSSFPTCKIIDWLNLQPGFGNVRVRGLAGVQKGRSVGC